VTAAPIETELRCEACGVAWDDPAVRWRGEWVDDEHGVAVYCPSCWPREFGGD